MTGRQIFVEGRGWVEEDVLCEEKRVKLCEPKIQIEPLETYPIISIGRRRDEGSRFLQSVREMEMFVPRI